MTFSNPPCRARTYRRIVRLASDECVAYTMRAASVQGAPRWFPRAPPANEEAYEAESPKERGAAERPRERVGNAGAR